MIGAQDSSCGRRDVYKPVQIVATFCFKYGSFSRKSAKPKITKYYVDGFVLHAAFQPQRQAIQQQVSGFNITGGEQEDLPPFSGGCNPLFFYK